MKCPQCSAVNEPGALACVYCAAVLASTERLGDGARALDARFDGLAADTARLLAAQELPAVGWQTAHVALARVGANVARMHTVLEASARAIPRPASAQEALVWLRRAPTLVWVAYGALGHTRSFALGYLYEVLAELYRDRGEWERRDHGLRAVFAQSEAVVRGARPGLAHGVRRFARTNPALALLLALLSLGVLWSWVGGATPSHRPRRSRRHAVIQVDPATSAGRAPAG